MNWIAFCRVGLALGVALILTACTPAKTLLVWQPDESIGALGDSVVVAVLRQEFIREQFERDFTAELLQRGVKAMPGHSFFAEQAGEGDRETLSRIFKDLGVKHIIITRRINRTEASVHRVSQASRAASFDDWYHNSRYASPGDGHVDGSAYFTLETKVFDMARQKATWIHFSEVKIDSSKQGVVNALLPGTLQAMESNGLINALP